MIIPASRPAGIQVFGRALGAYLLAVAIGGASAGLTEFADAWLGESDLRAVSLPHLLAGMMVLVAVCTILPGLVIITIAEIWRWRSVWFYIAAAATLGEALAYLFGHPNHLWAGLVAGPLAGYAYWRVAGRHAGAWMGLPE